MSFTWAGRQLTSAAVRGKATSYTYNSDGIRTGKTVDGVTTDYLVDGSTIVAQRTNYNTMWFLYDSDGTRVGFTYQDEAYYYMKNAQGDVTGIIDSDLNVVVEYTYDDWGKLIEITGSDANFIGKLNPFLYRGYYYDAETGLYYLNSRYYDPVTGRFLNADGQLNLKTGLTGLNLFCYGANNYVNIVDTSGRAFMFLTAVIGSIAGAIVGGAVAATQGKSILKGVLIGAAIGGLIGLGAGAATGALLGVGATAPTAVVLGTASMNFATSGTALGIAASKALDKVTNAYQKSKSVVTGSTDIFRSVSNAELNNIKKLDQFNLPAGGMESKQFAFSYTETLKFSQQPIINQTDIVRASVPNNMISQFSSIQVDKGIFSNGTMTVYGDMLDLFNQAVSGSIRIMP